MKKILTIFIAVFICIVCFYTVIAATGDLLPDDVAKISSSVVIQTKTGVGPFDSDDTPGNDSSEDNDIIRSFDQITWTAESTFILKNSGTEGKYNGGYIYVEGVLPEELKEIVVWDTDSMGWAQDVVLSEDKLTFTAKYHMTEDEVTVPGKQTLVFVAKVLGAGNGTKIKPDIKVWLNGNNDEDKVSVTGINEVTVSSAPNYNIKLVRNNYCSKRVTVDYESQEMTGRMYGYSVILQLYNKDSTKGLKGIEFPSGDFNFDIDLNLTRTDVNTKVSEDITDKSTPLLWNYKINVNGLKGVISDRTMQWLNGDEEHNLRDSPWGMATSNRKNSIYNSGNISMIQNGSKISVTISDYKFDGTFPKYNGEYNENTIIYGENIGCFSAGYFQILVPDNEETIMEDKNYYLTVSDSNLNAKSLTSQETTTQAITTDDSNTVTHVRLKKGVYGHFVDFSQISGYPLVGLTNRGRGGDTVMTLGNIFKTNLVASVGNDSDEEYYIYSVNQMYKFDGDAFEPYSDKITFTATSGFSFNAYYLTKKDGTNWNSQEEMNNTVELTEFNIYKNKADIPEGYICVGLFFESKSSGMWKPIWNTISVNMKIKETAKINQTYGMTIATMIWDKENELDRSIYTIEKNIDFSTYPKYAYNAGQMPYVKTEYNEDGSIVKGTHSGSYIYGNTVYVVGASQSVEIESIDDDGNTKINYDLGKNEYDVRYKISPNLSSENTNINIEGVTITLVDTLPEGLNYVAGSSNYGDPEITENSDGTTTLVWQIHDCGVGQDITPLQFLAHIDEESSNGKQYTNKVVISADKIGNNKEIYRTDSTTIQIINLSSHRLYKISETPVVELNEEIRYTLSYKNNTDYKISDFQLLDILPYNGDDRGTNYNGTYTLSKLVITQESSSGEILSNDNLQIFYTDDENVRTTVTSKDENLADGWNKTVSQDINAFVTAIALKGEIAEQTKVTIDIYIKPEGNVPLDKYINNASAQVYKETEEITTSGSTVQVIKRKIEGIVWYDTNADGIKDSSENIIPNVEMSLLNENGKTVVDIYGNEVTNIKTDENGYYSFNYLPKGVYYVEVLMPNNKYILTQKGVGTNSEINSKFYESNQRTDEITKLNTVDLPELTETNENAGLVKKETQVIVKYIDINSNEEIYTQDIIDGRIDDSYITVNELDNINLLNDDKYEFVKVEGKESGTMTEDVINITYYYQKKDAYVLVKHIDQDGNLLSEEIKISGRVDDEYETKEKEFNDYILKIKPDNANGNMTLEEIVVTYVYEKVKGKITITKIDSKDNTKLLEGATFKIEKLTDDGNVDSIYIPVEKTTDNFGKVEFTDLDVGKYKVTEIKAPDGYNLAENHLEIDINKNNYNIEIKAENKMKIILPNTGGKNYNIFCIFIGIFVLFISIYVNNKLKLLNGNSK